ncbi:guanine nucleotide-binding protein g(o) subunit alpha [Anaeramoeba ignava]|uniref:Guanine nucleotide-binding protein g(O) subunit alpha n=1 Tax=Anaeramoeba ignava TaxID=1746090 RepID=A0A9Q0LW39_ANAIG|nr:guanine nucleotide-binding protein g(o) subunit alpha [Anaeramoeba ignava]
MGNCGGGASSKEFERSKEIEKRLNTDRAQFDNEIKVLLLGSGDSGKSTFLKQMRILHNQKYTEKEKQEFKSFIYGNILQDMRALTNAIEAFELNYSNPDNIERAKYFKSLSLTDENYSQEVWNNAKLLWEDPGLKKTYEHSSEFQINESAGYFLDQLNVLSSPDYVPSVEDILHVRVKTTGITETQFSDEDFSFRMVDVGGQRNERKKWIHCFQGVTTIIFLVGASEYDQTLEEDETQNRMAESLSLFDEICNSDLFQDTRIILFLNKIDIFEKKIKKTDLSVCFPEYTGGPDFETAQEFIKQKFLGISKRPSKQIECHSTCATNTENIKVVFKNVKEHILNSALGKN